MQNCLHDYIQYEVYTACLITCWFTIVIVVWINMHTPSMLSHALINILWLFVLIIMQLHRVLSINCHVFHHYLDVCKIFLSLHFLWLCLTINIYFNMLNHNDHISKDWPNFTFQWTYHPRVFYLTTTAIVCTSCIGQSLSTHERKKEKCGLTN